MNDQLEQVRQMLRENPSMGWRVVEKELGVRQGQARQLLAQAKVVEPSTMVPIDQRFPGITIGENYLSIDPEVPLDTIQACAMSLLQMEDRLPWLIGDLFLECKRRFQRENPSAANYSPNRDPNARGITKGIPVPTRVGEYIRVAEYYVPAHRFSASWSIHREAIAVGDSSRTAHTWVQLASDEGWTREEFRDQVAAFRQGLKALPQKKDEVWSIGFEEIGKVVNKIQTVLAKERDRIRPEDRPKVREMLRPVVEFYNTLTPR